MANDNNLFQNDLAVDSSDSANDESKIELLSKLLERESIAKNNNGQFLPDKRQLKLLVNCVDDCLDKTNKLISLKRIDTSNVKNMKALFYKSNREDFSGIEDWNVSSVVGFELCFAQCKTFNAEIEKWGDKVKNARTFEAMFWGADSFDRPIGVYWDTSSATNMIRMFNQAKNFNNGGQPFGEKWKMDKVCWTWQMFWGAERFNQELNHWNMSSVTKCFTMFMNAKAFNQPLDKWDLSNAVDLSNMFNKAESFNQDLSAWGDKLGKAQNMKRMFADTKSLTIDFLGAWKIPEGCNIENFTKGSALESTTKTTKLTESKLSNFSISEIYSGIVCKAEWGNDEFLGRWLPNNIKEQFKVYLAKYDENDKLAKADKDSWEFAFCEVFGYCFLIEKISENSSGLSDDITKNREFNILQGRGIKDFDGFDDSKSECIYSKNDIEIHFAPQSIWIVNSAKYNNSETILSIINAFVLLKAYKAKMRELDDIAKNYKTAQDLQKSHENLCKFDLHSYQNMPIAQNELESTLLIEVWRKMSDFYMVAPIHDELKETIFQISQLVSTQKQDKLNGIMRWVAGLSAFAAAYPVIKDIWVWICK